MKNRDTILLEEAYNKTRLLKEESMTREGEPVVRDVDSFNRQKTKEDRMYRQIQQATDQADTEVAPNLGPVSDEDIIWIADLESQVGRLRQEIKNGRDVVLKHLEEGPAFILS